MSGRSDIEDFYPSSSSMVLGHPYMLTGNRSEAEHAQVGRPSMVEQRGNGNDLVDEDRARPHLDVIRFALLGKVRGWRGSEELAMGGPQQQAMLVALLLRPGGTATGSSLIDALWGEHPPVTATTALRTYAWRLRRVLRDACANPRTLLTVGDGYRLLVPDEAVDSRRAQALADRALTQRDPEVAHALVSEALAMWEGEPLAGVSGPYAQSQRLRLAELRLALLERRLGLDTELGRAAWCVPELQSLSDEHPLRESLYLLLMRALHASGRHGDALAVFPRARRRLVEELGVEPGAELTSAHQRLLAGDAPLPMADERSAHANAAPPSTVPRPAQVPASTADFTGRASVAHELVDALTSADRHTLPIVAIAGMGGVGKTMLARRVAHQVRENYPDGQLYADLRGGDAAPANPETVLAGFLTALGVAAVPDGLAARSSLFLSLTHGRRLLVVLDDARSLAQVEPLLPGAESCGVLVTSRSRLLGLSGAVHAELTVFTHPEAIELLRRVIGDDRVAAEPEAARELVEACGLLPLAVRISAARLAARPSWTIDMLRERLADERRRLATLRAGDLDVTATFTASWRHLTDEHRRALVLLAVHDMPDVPLPIAADVLDSPEPETEDLLEELVDVALLESAAPDRYRFHPLVRSFARDRDLPGKAEQIAASQARLFDGLVPLAVGAFHQAVPADPVSEPLGAVRLPQRKFDGRAAGDRPPPAFRR